VLFLKDTEREKYLPVWIGELEASSIELAVIRKSAPRPLTHDLFTSVLRQLGVHLHKVVIDKLENGTYYASMHLRWEGGSVQVDCRPSDAIAMALRENTLIFVDDELMYNIKFVELTEDEEAALAAAGEDGGDDDDDDDGEDEREYEPQDENTFQDFLRRISPTDFKDG
jgi:bifunctional DNase/RNase